MPRLKINREIFLDELPRKSNKRNKNKNAKRVIDWKLSIGYWIKFIYGDIGGKVKIINYDLDSHEITVEYNNSNHHIKMNSFVDCHLGKMLGKISNDFKVKIGDTLKNKKRDFIIIERKHELYGKRQQDTKWYKYHCNKCDFEDWITEEHLIGKREGGCRCCGYSSKLLIEGKNDLPSTNPELVKYFMGGYEEAKQYKKGSNARVIFKCPDCGKVKDKTMAVNDLNQGFSCDRCGDGMKMPEKTMYSVLEQLDIDFIPQLSKRILSWCDKYKYDFYIKDLDCKIIETHGLQHYAKSFKFKKGRNLEQEQENDRV
ncbi:MAG TPA: hypothetical protein VIK86_09415, partial [Candidatus Paceibacterota bacterium]